MEHIWRSEVTSATEAGAFGRRLSVIVDRYAPWLLASVVLAVSLAIYRDPWRPGVVGAAVLTAAAAGVARDTPVLLFVSAAAVWLTLGMWPATPVAAYYAATHLRGRRLAGYVTLASALVAVAGVAGVLLSTPVWNSHSLGDVMLLVSGLVLAPTLAGLWVAARRQVVTGLRDHAAQLEREQLIRAEQARTQERARIAREMHDVVAHRVTLMVLQAGALEVSAHDSRTIEAAETIRRTGRDALTELRQILGVLRSNTGEDAFTPQPVLADLPRLLDSVRGTGVPVRYRDEGDPQPLPATAERAIYRIIQESLLNVRKHAPGATSDVLLRHGDPVVVEIHSGPAPDADPPGQPIAVAELGAAEEDGDSRVRVEAQGRSRPKLGAAEEDGDFRVRVEAQGRSRPNTASGPPSDIQPRAGPRGTPGRGLGSVRDQSRADGPPGSSTRHDDGLPYSGLGLIGLAERVELLGGELVAGPGADGGFLVRAVVPLTASRAPDAVRQHASGGPENRSTLQPAAQAESMPPARTTPRPERPLEDGPG